MVKKKSTSKTKFNIGHSSRRKVDAEAVPWDEISRTARFRGGAWRPSISHCVLLGSSGKRFPCLWKINLFEYSETRYPLKVSTGTSHRVRPVRHLRHEQQPETWTFLVSLRALWIVTPLKLRRKVPYISLLEEMVSSRSCGGAFVTWMCPTRLKIALTRPFKTDQRQ